MMPELGPELRTGKPAALPQSAIVTSTLLIITNGQRGGRSKAGSAHTWPHLGESVNNSRFGTTELHDAATGLDYALCSRHVDFRNFIFRRAKLLRCRWVCHTTTLRMVAKAAIPSDAQFAPVHRRGFLCLACCLT